MFKVLTRIFRDKIATEPISFAGSDRFRGPVAGKGEIAELKSAAQSCPTGAFAVYNDDYKIDYRKCLFCGNCVEKCTGLEHDNVDAMPVILNNAMEVTAAVIRQKLGRSLHVRHLDAGSCNACDFEMGAMSNPYYDLHRFGVHFDASPRHADLLMVTGVVTRNLEAALRMSYEAMPEPKLVMACGACAAGGETYGASYAIVGAADEVVPVDIYVPGCPPRPSAMIAGLLAAADMLAKRL